MNSVEEKRAQRLQFMDALYDVVDGFEGQQLADMTAFLSKLGLNFDKEEDFNEFQSIARYLKGEGLIETIDVESGTIAIGGRQDLLVLDLLGLFKSYAATRPEAAAGGELVKVISLPAGVLRKQRAGRFAREGLGEVVALGEVAPDLPQTGELPFGLHALGYHPLVQGVREGHHRR